MKGIYTDRKATRQINRLRHVRKVAMEAALLIVIGLVWGAVFAYSLISLI